MPRTDAGPFYPHERVLLARTKLAYVHLRNLLTDAKRDRAGRVFGYVEIWLESDLLLLYMQEGELVNATCTGPRGCAAIAIAEALGRVPPEPEYGEICFHEADDEQLACMYATQLTPCEPWPSELNPLDPASLFPYLMATTYDGVVEILVGGCVNYLVFRDGSVERAYLASPYKGTLVERVQQLFANDPAVTRVTVRRWPVPDPLPVQAPPALIQAYREVTTALVQRLVAGGRDSAPMIAEQARQNLLDAHPTLQHFTVLQRPVRDPVVDTPALTGAMAAWISEMMWAVADHDSLSPEALLKDITWSRRHMFQSAGLYDLLSWQIE